MQPARFQAKLKSQVGSESGYIDTEKRRWGQRGFGEKEDRMHLTVDYAHRDGVFVSHLEVSYTHFRHTERIILTKGIEDRQEVGKGKRRPRWTGICC